MPSKEKSIKKNGAGSKAGSATQTRLCAFVEWIYGLRMKIMRFIATVLFLSILSMILLDAVRQFCHPQPTEWLDYIKAPFTNALSMGNPVCLFVKEVDVTLTHYYGQMWADAASEVKLAWFH